jgi:hypothetical protein
MMVNSILDRIRRYDDDHAWMRQFVIPEEDRHLYTSMRWSGEYRWFRSPNIICLEKARLVRQQEAQLTAA